MALDVIQRIEGFIVSVGLDPSRLMLEGKQKLAKIYNTRLAEDKVIPESIKALVLEIEPYTYENFKIVRDKIQGFLQREFGSDDKKLGDVEVDLDRQKS